MGWCGPSQLVGGGGAGRSDRTTTTPCGGDTGGGRPATARRAHYTLYFSRFHFDFCQQRETELVWIIWNIIFDILGPFSKSGGDSGGGRPATARRAHYTLYFSRFHFDFCQQRETELVWIIWNIIFDILGPFSKSGGDTGGGRPAARRAHYTLYIYTLSGLGTYS